MLHLVSLFTRIQIQVSCQGSVPPWCYIAIEVRTAGQHTVECSFTGSDWELDITTAFATYVCTMERMTLKWLTCVG